MNNTNEHTSSLSGVKRSSEKDQEVLQDAETAEPVQKQLKLDHKPAANSAPSQITPVATAPMTTPLSQQGETDEQDEKSRKLLPAPFFFYRDHSTEVDDDPLTPLTPLARVPNFPAKMHAILSRPDLADIVAWMPHGRSWRVLKPREFEIRVIPTYFDHQKFSSFIRQANGWGFRRITQGRDRNSYYNELFLRGMPHLCKKMKRPGVSKKVTFDAEHEPDFYTISDMHSLQDTSDADGNILLPCTLMGGPKARVPVGMMGATGTEYDTALAQSQLQRVMLASKPSSVLGKAGESHQVRNTQTKPGTGTTNSAKNTFPGRSVLEGSFPPVPESSSNQTSISAFNQLPMALAASLHQLPTMNASPAPHQNPAMLSALLQQQSINMDSKPTSQATLRAMLQAQSQLYLSSVAANQQAAAMQQAISMAMQNNSQTCSSPGLGNDPVSQFAAGFAAATAVSDSQFRSALSKVLSANAAATSKAIPNSGADSSGRQVRDTPTPAVEHSHQGNPSTNPLVDNLPSIFPPSRGNHYR